MAKAKMIYILKDEFVDTMDSRKSWSKAAYESCADAFDRVLKEIITMKRERRDVKWSIAFDKCNHDTVVIKGEGTFPSRFEDDMFDPIEGIQTYTIEEIVCREASK